MNGLLEIVVSNSVVALALAVVVAGISRLRVNPNVAHILWLMVLVKFLTPPFWQVGLSWPQASPEPAVEEVVISPEPQFFIAVRPTPMPMDPPEPAPSPAWAWPEILLAVWGAGVLCIIGITLLRVCCFRVILKKAEPAPPELIQLLEGLSKRLGVRNVPETLLLPVRISPAVWCLSLRPRILLPFELVRDMDRDQFETILAHELAHIRRGDHLVRLLELAVTTAFWWNPVVWWVRRNLREMEEHCCDALVLEALPDSARRYAIALIETVEFLSNQPGRLPIGATAAKPTVTLTRRIQMLKTGSHVRRLSAKSLIALFAALIVPMTLAFGEDDEATELQTKVYRLGDLDANAIEKNIVEKIAPNDWAKAGGPHTIKRTKKGLAVTASETVHQQIALVLELQKLIERQTELEQRLKAYNSEKRRDDDDWVIESILRAYNPEKPGESEKGQSTDDLWRLSFDHWQHMHHGRLNTPYDLLINGILINNCQECHQANATSDTHSGVRHPHCLGQSGGDRKTLSAWLDFVVPAPVPEKAEEPKDQEKPDHGKAAIVINVPATGGEVTYFLRDGNLYMRKSSGSSDEPVKLEFQFIEPEAPPKDAEKDSTRTTEAELILKGRVTDLDLEFLEIERKKSKSPKDPSKKREKAEN